MLLENQSAKKQQTTRILISGLKRRHLKTSKCSVLTPTLLHLVGSDPIRICSQIDSDCDSTILWLISQTARWWQCKVAIHPAVCTLLCGIFFLLRGPVKIFKTHKLGESVTVVLSIILISISRLWWFQLTLLSVLYNLMWGRPTECIVYFCICTRLKVRGSRLSCQKCLKS